MRCFQTLVGMVRGVARVARKLLCKSQDLRCLNSYRIKIVTEDTAYLEQVKAEHYGLEQLLRQLEAAFALARARKWLSGSTPRLVELVSELHDQIERHFAQEEVGGYMEEALSRAPRFSTRVETLLKQHHELARAVRDLLSRAQGGRDNPGIWDSLDDDLRALIKKLKAHEAGENHIIEAAFNEDLGLAD